MQYAMLLAALGAAALGARRFHALRAMGRGRDAARVYRLGAWLLGLGALLGMGAQLVLLALCGKLNLRTALPLHLCSAMGVAALPMLLGGWQWLWQVCLYLATPGALLALIFPAIAQTPWPGLTRWAFFFMHTAVALSPVWPLLCGARPNRLAARQALGFLMGLAAAAAFINWRTGANYLFLSAPPLPGLRFLQGGAWFACLAAAAALFVCAEGALWALVCKIHVKS